MLFRRLAAIGLLLLAAGCAAAQDESKKDQASAGAEKDQPRSFESKGRVSAGGKNVAYKVIAGETYVENDKGEPVASIFSTSYIADGYADPRTRPVAFIFNGGPGSASLWLHMGVFGQTRVRLPSGPDAGPDDDGAAPFDLIANPESIIDVADMVFIDPVGTGW
jgi:carboxypeptidase C (cathepsin A)